MSAIKFTINGKQHIISSGTEADTTLNTYLRNHANLRGTKVMCREGGCGVCIVAASIIHPVTKKRQTLAVNSCLVSVLSCHGWNITTNEGVGNKLVGYHPIQTRLASFNGTQCGFCSSGWVLNMYSLMDENKDGLTMKDIENSFAGNLCRCTGYRPILDAFKSFAKDADPALLEKVIDIEDIEKLKLCAKSGKICTKTCDDYSEYEFCKIDMDRSLNKFCFSDECIYINNNDSKWFKVYKIKDIFDIFAKEGTSSYMLVAGNTARGVYHVDELPKLMIDITSVSELKEHKIDANMILGGGMSLNEIMEFFQESAKNNLYYKYTLQMYHHLDLVAHVPVRNIGTIAGNLSIKHQHNDFPSDVFLLLATIGAVLTINEDQNNQVDVSMVDYLKMDMKGKIIRNINLPPISPDYIFQTYKIMPRAQNAHACVNAGFLFKFNNDKTAVEKASIVFGNINSKFINAQVTEKFLQNKNIFNNAVLKLAIQTLANEIFPENNPPEPSPEYRKLLALGLFYKYLLHINPTNNVNPRYKSGGEEFERPISKGEQKFDTDKNIWPLNQPIPKIEATVQCSGEAEYVDDIPTLPGELYAAFVLSTICNATIDKIDKEAALVQDGVVAILTAQDIPGRNNFVSEKAAMPDVEEILCSEKVLYYGQPIAIIIAESERLAKLATKKVKVTYKNISSRPPVLTIEEALKAPDSKKRIVQDDSITPKSTGKDVKKVIKSSFKIHQQYHFAMETMSCVCIPVEDGLDIYPTTQWMDLVNVVVADALKIPENNINIKVRRLGGAYGSKISRSSQVITACALSAYKLNRPVRFVLSYEDNMITTGKRLAVSCDYEVGVNDQGKIQYLKSSFYEDDGCTHNEKIANYALGQFTNCYDTSTWAVQANSVLTDTTSNTWCRAPGSTEGIAMIENIMEHISTVLEKDPTEVRLVNMTTSNNPLPDLIDDFKKSTDYEKRLENVKNFNRSNRWRKRGINLTPMEYDLEYFGNFSSLVSIYRGDGTVTVSHAGIEMGQGLNTKVAQVCAHTLGIPLEMVTVKPSNNLTAPNSMVSGGSIASEVCCFATVKACEILLERLKPIKEKAKDAPWPELILQAYLANIDLCSHYMYSANDDVKPYKIYGVSVVEVEVDMLTGNHQVLRADILEDTGESLSPTVDVGQVEGAYIMGLGYWTFENIIFDPKSGKLLTDRTWTYKPLGIKDIPQDFRVNFRHSSPNPAGVLRSKATGEPPLCMAVGIVFALRQAIRSARVDNGSPSNEWCDIKLPLTVENILLAVKNNINDFTY